MVGTPTRPASGPTRWWSGPPCCWPRAGSTRPARGPVVSDLRSGGLRRAPSCGMSGRGHGDTSGPVAAWTGASIAYMGGLGVLNGRVGGAECPSGRVVCPPMRPTRATGTHSNRSPPCVRTAPAILVDYHAAVAAQARDLLDDLSAGHFAMAIDERWNPPVTLGVRPESLMTTSSTSARRRVRAWPRSLVRPIVLDRAGLDAARWRAGLQDCSVSSLRGRGRRRGVRSSPAGRRGRGVAARPRHRSW